MQQVQQASRFQSLSAVNSPYFGLGASPHLYNQQALYNTLPEDEGALGLDLSMYGRWSQGDTAYRRQQQQQGMCYDCVTCLIKSNNRFYSCCFCRCQLESFEWSLDSACWYRSCWFP